VKFWKIAPGFVLANPGVFGYDEKKRFKSYPAKTLLPEL
jgi:hypothetical protein